MFGKITPLILVFISISLFSIGQGNNDKSIKIEYFKTERYFYERSKSENKEQGVLVYENQRVGIIDSNDELINLIENKELDNIISQKNIDSRVFFVLTEDMNKLSEEPKTIIYNSVDGTYKIKGSGDE